MFSKISWQQFTETIIILCLVYYFFIAVIFFRGDILKIVKEGLPAKSIQQKQPGELPEVKEDDANAVLFSAVHELMEELKIVFVTAAAKKFIKQELLMALQSKLTAYKQLKATAFGVAVSNHIVQQAKQYCGIELAEKEIAPYW